VAVAHLLGEGAFGRWLGVTEGNPWWAADRSICGAFETSFVKVVPNGDFWTACFNPVGPVVDVDIVLPVQWVDDALEEVDPELDVLRSVDGSVRVRDREESDRVREAWAMPDDVARQAEETCERFRALVELGAEPFGTVGRAWLSHSSSEAGAAPVGWQLVCRPDAPTMHQTRAAAGKLPPHGRSTARAHNVFEVCHRSLKSDSWWKICGANLPPTVTFQTPPSIS